MEWLGQLGLGLTLGLGATGSALGIGVAGRAAAGAWAKEAREGNPLNLTVKGITARIIQHEIDHLDGVLFVDRLSPIKRELVKKKLKKRLKKESG